MINSNDKLNNDDTTRGKLRAEEDWNALVTELMNVAKIKSTVVDTTKSDVLTTTLLELVNDRIFDVSLVSGVIKVNSNQNGDYDVNANTIFFFRGSSSFPATAPISLDGFTKYTRNEDGTKPPEAYEDGLIYVVNYYGGYFRVGKWIIGKSGIEHNWFGNDRSISILDERTKGTGENNIIIGKDSNNPNISGSYNYIMATAPANKLTTGSYNVGLGASYAKLSTGKYNVGLGNSFYGLTSGQYNIGIGFQALNTVSTSNANIGIGTRAGRASTGTYNVYMGEFAAATNATGTYNVAIGFNANSEATKGLSMVTIGFLAGKGSTGDNTIAIGTSSAIKSTGANNVGIGYKTLYGTTTGSDIVAIGDKALYANTTGKQNVGIGYNAGIGITTGYGNIAIGKDTLATTGAGYMNIALGEQSGNAGNGGITLGYQSGKTVTGNGNTFIGSYAGKAVTTSTDIIGIGYECVNNSKACSYSVAIGYKALVNGISVVSIGPNAGTTSASNDHSVSIGNGAGSNSGPKDYSISIGKDANNSTADGQSSVSIGLAAGKDGSVYSSVAIGTEAANNGTLSRSTALGTMAGYKGNHEKSVIIGDRAGYSTWSLGSVFIGYEAGTSTAMLMNVTNSAYILPISYLGTTTGFNYNRDNIIVLGNPDTEELICNVELTTISDRRDKENIKPQEDMRDIINALKPVSFTWNKRVNRNDNNEEEDVKVKSDDVQFGFIAQDFQQLQKDFPILKGSGIVAGDEKYLGIRTNQFISMLVNNVQTLNKEVGVLKEENKKFREELDELKKLIKK